MAIDRVKDGERVDYGFSGVVDANAGEIMHVELSQRMGPAGVVEHVLRRERADRGERAQAGGIHLSGEFSVPNDLAAAHIRARRHLAAPFPEPTIAGALRYPRRRGHAALGV